MTNHTLLATWIKRFLQEYLISDRNLSANTQHSYRDTICLLVPFIARQAKKTNEKIEVEDITAERIKRFLLDLEQTRHCSISTRNWTYPDLVDTCWQIFHFVVEFLRTHVIQG